MARTFDDVRDIWIRISRYDPLTASSFIALPDGLDNSMKGLINIKNRGVNDCFKCCHARLINPKKPIPKEYQVKEIKKY